MEKKRSALSLMSLLFFALAFFAMVLVRGEAKSTSSSEPEIPSVREPQVLGDDEDAHGCIGSAGYTWCPLKERCLRLWEEPCQLEEDITLIFKNLQEETEIGFLSVDQAGFSWFLSLEENSDRVKEKEIEGMGLEATLVTSEELNKIDAFFGKYKFEANIKNFSLGSSVNTTAYQKNNLACLVTSFLEGREEDVFSVKVNCGFIN